MKEAIKYLVGAILGFVIALFTMPKQQINVKEYELQSKIQELQHQHQTDSIKHQIQREFIEFERGDTTYRDSILIHLGY